MAGIPDNNATWVVCQLGARLHYAVPRLLHKHGQLEHFHTDILGMAAIQRLGEWWPGRWQPAALKHLLGRAAGSLPADRVTSYPFFGWRYYRKRKRAWDAESHSVAHLWAGKEFGRRVVRRGFGNAGAVYTFNTAALEILQAAREQGLFTVVEQTIAPRAVEEDLLAEEERLFPGWEPTRRRRGAATLATIERESREWELADLITCGSQFVKDGIARCGGPVERCVVVPYGVDATFAPLTRAPHDGPLRILSVGEGGLRKGLTYASVLAERLSGEAEFRWVGPVNLTAEATQRVARHVCLTGTVPRSQILPHYAWADVFFLPSVCEGSATTIYEALQSGLPVITTPNSGSLVRDGENGFIIPIRDLDTMEQRLRELRRDPGLRFLMSSAARASHTAVSLEAYEARLLKALNKAEAALPALQPGSPRAISDSSAIGPEGARAPVSAIVTAHTRPAETTATLERLRRCRPMPAEIIVHVDNNGQELAAELRQNFPDLRILVSRDRIGPGGSRNLLLKAAKESLVASFDDDSYPADIDFFQRVVDAAAAHPDAAMLAAAIFYEAPANPEVTEKPARVATFVGCGCVYRREMFLETSGYVPLPLAYGMEEVDLSLRLHAMGRSIVQVPALRVVHKVDVLRMTRNVVLRPGPKLVDEIEPQHRDTHEISAAMVSNLALLAFLRYPVLLWPIGLGQCLRKAMTLVINGRWRGALAGLWNIPRHLWQHRKYRAPLKTADVFSHFRLRRHPVELTGAGPLIPLEKVPG